MGNTTINNFVAQHISKELGDKILSNTLKPVNKDTTFYISNTGDDKTADGTQEKPFKTLQSCYDYIRANYYFCKANSGISISFLTDYTDTANEFLVKPMGNTSYTNVNYIRLLLNNKNVVLKKILAEGCNLTVNGEGSFLIDASASVTPLQINYRGNVTFKCPVSINLKNTHPYLITAYNYGTCEFDDTVTVNFTEECQLTSLFYAFRYSRIRFSKTITLTGSNVSVTKGTVNSSLYSYIAFYSDSTFKGTTQITGKRFDLTLMSMVDTIARGKEFIPGSQDGTVGETCYYV